MFDEVIMQRMREEVAAEVVARLTPLLASGERPDQWLDSKRAADYLGLTVDALHKLTAAGTVPHSQDAPGGKCWFQRSQLDAWRMERAKGPQTVSTMFPA